MLLGAATFVVPVKAEDTSLSLSDLPFGLLLIPLTVLVGAIAAVVALVRPSRWAGWASGALAALGLGAGVWFITLGEAVVQLAGTEPGDAPSVGFVAGVVLLAAGLVGLVPWRQMNRS